MLDVTFLIYTNLQVIMFRWVIMFLLTCLIGSIQTLWNIVGWRSLQSVCWGLVYMLACCCPNTHYHCK